MKREEAIEHIDAMINSVIIVKGIVPDEYDMEAFHMAIAALQEQKRPTINHIAKEIHTNAIEHGWWEEERSLGEIVALCHSELSEALEAYRNGEPMMWMNEDKPDGIAIEMIDCMIRILDYLAKENIDIDRLLMMKHEYNKTRTYKHGNKKL